MNKEELIRDIKLIKEFLNDALLNQRYVEAYKYKKHLDKCENELDQLKLTS